jgi:SAM-dependent methyltransferase
MPGQDPVHAYYAAILPFYDLELSDRRDVRFWLRLVRRLEPRAVLEIGTGTGRIALPLGRLLQAGGGSVVGLDCSAEMLERAREKAAQSRNPRLAGHVHFVCADVRAFDLGRQFDLVLAADDPFAHLLDDGEAQAAFTAIARHLSPGGSFVLELPLERGTAAGRSCLTTGEREIVRGGRRLQVRMEQRIQPGGTISRVAFSYRLYEGTRLVRRAHRTFSARGRGPADIAALCAGAGLSVRERWGGFDDCPFDPERSGELIVRAVRPV